MKYYYTNRPISMKICYKFLLKSNQYDTSGDNEVRSSGTISPALENNLPLLAEVQGTSKYLINNY